jgi:hypothetical protein
MRPQIPSRSVLLSSALFGLALPVASLVASLQLGGCDGKGGDTGPADSGPGDSDDGGDDPDDRDQDGVTAADGDCDDGDPLVYPGADERCNGIDDDCDGAPHADERDDDGDGGLDCSACADAGMWARSWEISDSAGLDALFENVLSGTACPDYGDARTFMFMNLDNVDGTVEGVYTGALFDVGQTTPDWDVVNTEHAWPRGDGALEEPRECDLHHLFVADADANNTRSDHPFGVVTGGTDWSQGGSTLGRDASGDLVFEPRDAAKGDIARAMLYFASRYADDIDVETQRDAAHLALFKSWHAADPPTRDEQLRSLRIASEQGVANPYVVCPDLVNAL